MGPGERRDDVERAGDQSTPPQFEIESHPHSALRWQPFFHHRGGTDAEGHSGLLRWHRQRDRHQHLSNVLKLFRVLEKSDEQRVHYHPGVGIDRACKAPGDGSAGSPRRVQSGDRRSGSIRMCSPATAFCARIIRRATGSFCSAQPRRSIPCGFSCLHLYDGVAGPRDQLDLAGYASLPTRGPVRTRSDPAMGPTIQSSGKLWHFRQIAEGRLIQIEFIGVWDTVAPPRAAAGRSPVRHADAASPPRTNSQRISAGDVDRRAPPDVPA